jgi:DNA-binding MarR family transcriptional regulator
MADELSSMPRRVLRALGTFAEAQLLTITNRQLADHLQVSPFSISRALSELERANYILISWQSPDPGHQRWSGRSIKLLDKQ